MTHQTQPGNRARALALLEAAEFMRDAHFRDGLTVQEITTALAHTVDRADAMVGSLSRDGFGAEEIAEMLSAEPAAVSAAVAPPTQAAVLSPTERAMLTYALDQAQEHIWSRDGFTDEDQAAIDSLRRMADEPAPAAVSAAVAPPTNHGLSVQHADALYDAIATPGPARESFDDQHARVCAVVRQILDDLLPTPAEPTDRAAVLHEVADELTRKANKLTERVHDLAYFVAKDRLREAEILDREATELRRMADETATETPTNRATHPCNAATMHRLGNQATAHGPHLWVMQPGMDPVHCPGTRKPPMDPVHILGIWADDQPAAEARQDEPPRPSLRDQHRAAWHALTPAEQTARIAELDAIDGPAAGARQDGATS